MEPNPKYSQLASEEEIRNVTEALKENGIAVEVVETAADAKERALVIIPPGSSVFTMSSQTLIDTGLKDEIDEGSRYESVRNKLTAMGKEMAPEKRQLGAAPDWSLGSVHAVTQDGKILVASNTGSQLPAYAYGSVHVLWVVGTQKIVKDLEDGMKRLYEYALPLEDKRARQAYGRGSGVNKILVINKEPEEGRLKVIFVKAKLGF